MAWSRPRSSPAGSSCFAVASQERLQHAVLLHARRRTTTVSPTSSCRVPRSSRCLSVGSRGWPRAGHRLRRALRPRSESKQARKKERKKENRDTAHANAPTPEITRCLTGRNPKGPPSEAPRAPAPPPPPPIFDALVRCATTSLRYVRWRGATPTRDSSFFTAYAATLPLRGVSEPPPRSPNQRVDASSARRVGALLLLRLRTARSRSAPPCINLLYDRRTHIYTNRRELQRRHPFRAVRPLCAVVRGKQPFRYCLLIDCIRPHPRLLASGRSPQCIEGISFTKSFTLKNRVLHLVVRELTSMPQSPQPLTAMRSRCAEMASIFGLAWRLARRLRALAR